MGETRGYDSFEVVSTPTAGNRIHIRASGEAGEASADVETTLGPDRVAGWLDEYRAVIAHDSAIVAPAADGGTQGPGAQRSLPDLGQELFELLFPHRIARLWHEYRGRALEAGRGLRLQIHLDLGRQESAWLAALPWEILKHEDMGGFLGLQAETPVVRHLDLWQGRRPFPRPDRWRLLVVAPEPYGLDALDVEREQENLETRWGGDGRIELVFPESCTYQGIQDALRQGPIHGVHFMGHGVFDEGSGVGGLVLEGSTGAPHEIRGDGLVGLFRDAASSRPVPVFCVLNGCQTGCNGMGGGEKAFGGAAAALMKAGVSAVVAMQAPISDHAAIEFSRTLYGALQDGFPVEGAVSAARAVLARGQDDPAWSVPALYMRVTDGRIFEASREDEESPRVAAPWTIPKQHVEGRDFTGT